MNTVTAPSAPAPLRVNLAGRTAYVTGGSRGIAAAIVAALARNGARVMFSFSPQADARSGLADSAERLVAELTAEGFDVRSLAADMSEPSDARAAATEALAALGSVDILVLSASAQIHRSITDMSPEDIDLQLRMNISANIATLQVVAPVMRHNGYGRIIAIGSVQAQVPSQEMPVYSMTKSALENLVCNMAVDNAPYGITVNNIAPGLIQTDRNAFRRKDMDQWNRLARLANPMGRAGQPEDVAGVALFLASDHAAFVTGATLHVTGGSHIARNMSDLLLNDTTANHPATSP